jgi:hypothetical protein
MGSDNRNKKNRGQNNSNVPFNVKKTSLVQLRLFLH